MRHLMPLVIACLLVVAGAASAQERIALPPQPVPAGPSAAPPDSPGYQVQATPLAPPPPNAPAPAPYPPPLVPSPTSPNAPPGGAVYTVPPYDAPSSFLRGDSTGNPSFWIGIEGLTWWAKNQPLSVPVVTTGPASQGANAGNLNAPGTTSLNGPLNYGAAGGFRGFAGCWLETDHTVGLDGSFFYLAQQSAGFSVLDGSGTGGLVINEPVAGIPFVTQVSAPGVETGGVIVGATSRFAGGDVNLLYNLYRANGWTINLVGGYRYLELDESLTITGSSDLFTTTTFTDNAGNVLATAPPGSTIVVLDQFSTRNQFNGGQVGTEFEYLSGRWSIGGVAKVAIGDTHEVITINGTTSVFPVNGTPVQLVGGNFATLQIGQFSKNRFAVAPEGQLSIGYQITPGIRSQIGYDFLFLSSVARPGNQIDNTYDGAVHPNVPMASSTYWTQGLTLNLQFSF